MIESQNYLSELGKRLRTDEVAKMLGLNRKTVIKYWAQLGGQKLGRNLLFFENQIVQALERGVNHALPTGQEMDRPSYPSRDPEGEGIQEQAGIDNMGERAKVNAVRRILKTDNHAIKKNVLCFENFLKRLILCYQ